MPVVQPNTSDMIDMTPIDEGTYPAKVLACGSQTSKKGNMMIVPKFAINVDGDTREREAYQVIEGKGSGNFDSLLRACNMDDLADQYTDPEQNNPPFDTDVLVDQDLLVIVGKQMYEGQERDTITGYLKA